MQQLGTKPSYYIAFGNCAIIAGLMQVEIIGIIYLARMRDDGFFMSKSLCDAVDGYHLGNYS